MQIRDNYVTLEILEYLGGLEEDEESVVEAQKLNLRAQPLGKLPIRATFVSNFYPRKIYTIAASLWLKEEKEGNYSKLSRWR